MAKASSENDGLKKILTHLTALDKKVDKGFKQMSALDKKMDNGFKEVNQRFTEVDQHFNEVNQHFTEVDQRFNEVNQHFTEVDQHFNEVNQRFTEVDQHFKEAAEDRQNIRNEVQILRHGMQLGFKSAEESQSKTAAAVAGLYSEIPKMGSELYDNIMSSHKEFQVFQQEMLSFQKRTEDFQQEMLSFQKRTENFQDEMRAFKQQFLDFQTVIQRSTEVLERIDRKFSVLEQAFEKLRADHEELKKEVAAKDAHIQKLEQALARVGVV